MQDVKKHLRSFDQMKAVHMFLRYRRDEGLPIPQSQEEFQHMARDREK